MVNSFLAGSSFSVTTGLEGNKSVQEVKIAALIPAASTAVTNDYTKTYLKTRNTSTYKMQFTATVQNPY